MGTYSVSVSDTDGVSSSFVMDEEGNVRVTLGGLVGPAALSQAVEGARWLRRGAHCWGAGGRGVGAVYRRPRITLETEPAPPSCLSSAHRCPWPGTQEAACWQVRGAGGET